MPRSRQPEKDRLKKSRLKKVSGALKFKAFRPSSPKEAKEYLRAVADHLSNLPNASTRFRFVALGIKQFLRGTVPLSHALGLAPKTTTKRGRPSVASSKVTAITKMLVEKVPVPKIAQVIGVSKSVVDRVGADYRAITWETALNKVDIGEELPEIEAKDAERRAMKVQKDRRVAILDGIASAIPLTKLLPEE